MTGWRTGLGHKVLRHAERVMPTARREWARAMAAELEHLPERDRLSFALGCVTSSYRQRLTDPATLLAAGRGAIILGLCAFAALCFRTANLLGAADPATLVATLGLICGVVALAFVRCGLRRLPIVAISGFAVAVLAIVAFGDVDALVGGAMPSSRFYRAILVEQVAGWVALFGFAHVLMTLENRRAVRD